VAGDVPQKFMDHRSSSGRIGRAKTRQPRLTSRCRCPCEGYGRNREIGRARASNFRYHRSTATLASTAHPASSASNGIDVRSRICECRRQLRSVTRTNATAIRLDRRTSRLGAQQPRDAGALTQSRANCRSSGGRARALSLMISTARAPRRTPDGPKRRDVGEA